MSVGFCVYPMKERVSADLIKEYENIPTSHISDSMNRLNGSTAQLTPYHKGRKLVGTAITVKTRPGDNLMIHKAIHIAQPGDVIVVDGGGNMTQALFGEIMMYTCKSKKIAGIIIDGCIRDVDAFRKDDFPIYAKGVTHKGPYKTGPGEVNVTVSVAGLIVNPGDLIVGDDDGIVSVSIQDAARTLEKAKEKIATEEKKIQSILAGEAVQTYISDDDLIAMGCTIYE